MITIGIYDNDPIFSDELRNIINRAMFPTSDCDVHMYYSSKELVQEIDSGTFDCQLLFMDILNDEGTGLQTAQYISEHTSNTDLIFVTSSEEYVYECYHYHAFAYILKPISEADISRELQRYFHNLNASPRYLTISYQGITHSIPISTISYIESNRRKLTIHTQQGSYHCYRKLNDIAEVLKDDGFIRCHQSYLLALDKITDYSSNHVYIQDTKLPISNRYQAELRNYFSQSAATQEQIEPSTSLRQSQNEYGAVICIKGAYLGSIIRIKPEQKIMIGRDGTEADMIINLPYVSRNHCTLLYHHDTMEYEIVDFSANGTYVNGDKRLLKNETYLLKPGSELSFGEKGTLYKLG